MGDFGKERTTCKKVVRFNLAAGLGVFDDEADGLELTAEFWPGMDSAFVHAQDSCAGAGSRIISRVRKPA